MSQSKTRRIAAIMFTDIVGYTALMQLMNMFSVHKKQIFQKVGFQMASTTGFFSKSQLPEIQTNSHHYLKIMQA